MILKKIIFFLVCILLYQTQLYSKSNSFGDFNSKNLAKYFSGIIALENKDNAEALDFFKSSKVLLDKHDTFLRKYVNSLVLEDKISQAISVIKKNKDKDYSDFFDAYLILTLDSIKKNDLINANLQLKKMSNLSNLDRFNEVVIKSLKQYVFVFKEKKIPKNTEEFGKLSIISETFQRCYLEDKKTETFFSQIINDVETNYTRYIFFYLSYLIENKKLNEAKEIIDELDYINSTLLLSQAKSLIQDNNFKQLKSFFTCKNKDDIISEFLFLISNLYSSQDNFGKSNFYLNLSNFMNPKFIFNLSLVADNQYKNREYKKALKTLKNFEKDNKFYHWYSVKKKALIIEKQKNIEESLNFIINEFKKIEKPNNKILFDIANFYKKTEKYEKSIEYYTRLINDLSLSTEIKSDLLYRRGGSYERIGMFEEADIDLLNALKLNPNDPYILNYLAYSWLERNYKIDDAIRMLENAYSQKSDDPYIIDSIGWAYFLINDYLKAEKFLKRAVELMPDDPIVNDHYGDILWRLDRKIQARYFWKNVLEMEGAENDLIKNINEKMIKGLENS